MLVLFTDTDCDVTPELAEEWGYKLISMPYNIHGKEVYPYIDFDKFDDKAYYDLLRTGVVPNTYAMNPYQYKEYFEPYFKNGDDILYVHFSNAMSGTFNAMHIALNELFESYPDRKFYEIDTKGITILSLNICYEVGKLYKEGHTAEEIVEWSKENIYRFTVYFFAEDLQFFRHSGRVSGLAAMFGSIIGVRPIMYMNNDGVMQTLGKEKGRRNAISKLIKYIEELGDDIKNHKIIIGHADCMEAVDALIVELKAKFGNDLDIMVVPVNPTIGAHCGPSTLGVTFHAKNR